MIRGHGDDAYQYPHITMDFSSNICASGGQQALLAHLVGNPQLVGHYPEPEPWSLERLIEVDAFERKSTSLFTSMDCPFLSLPMWPRPM